MAYIHSLDHPSLPDQYKRVKKIIGGIHVLSPRSLSPLLKIIDFQHVPKGCFIQKGKSAPNEYFILDGIVRTYVLGPEGKEVSLSFFQADSILSPYKTRTANSLSTIFAQAISPTKLAVIDAEKFYHLQANNQEVRSFAIKVLERELMLKTEKEMAMATLTATERLLQFRQKFPGLENQVPHSYIASYLGITHVSFSRLRASVGRQNGSEQILSNDNRIVR